MTCDINAQDQLTQPWNRIDPKTIVAIQCGLLCDALNGIDVTTELNPIALQGRYNCFARLSMSQLMGIWTTLFAPFLKIMATGGTATQVLGYNVDPNAELIVPPNPNIKCLCYQNGVAGGTLFQWVTPNGPWV